MSAMPTRRLQAAAAIALVGAATTLVGTGAGASYTDVTAAQQEISTGRLGIAVRGEGTASGPSSLTFAPFTNLTSQPAPMTRTATVDNTGTLDVPKLLLTVSCAAVRKTNGNGSGAEKSTLCNDIHLEVKDDRGVIVGAKALSSWTGSHELVVAPRAALAPQTGRTYTFTYTAPQKLNGSSMDSTMTVDASFAAFDVA